MKYDATPRAFIVKFANAQALYDLLLRTRAPLEKSPLVKGNRLFRLFSKSEFHACRDMLKSNIAPSDIESIYQYNEVVHRKVIPL